MMEIMALPPPVVTVCTPPLPILCQPHARDETRTHSAAALVLVLSPFA
jgi:hypothetical protein